MKELVCFSMNSGQKAVVCLIEDVSDLDLSKNTFLGKHQNFPLLRIEKLSSTDRSKLKYFAEFYDVVITIGGTNEQNFMTFELVANALNKKLIVHNETNLSKQIKIPESTKITNTGQISVLQCENIIMLRDLRYLPGAVEFLPNRKNEIFYYRHFYLTGHRDGDVDLCLVEALKKVQSPTRKEKLNVVVENVTNYAGKEFTSVLVTSNDLTQALKCELGILTAVKLLRMDEGICINHEAYQFVEKFSWLSASINTIEKCFTDYNLDEIFLCFNGGKDCTALLHLALVVLTKLKADVNLRDLQIVCIRSETDPFEAINEFIQKTVDNYGLNILFIDGPIKQGLQSVLDKCPKLTTALMGTRRTDPYSKELKHFQVSDPGWPKIMRVHPILDWCYNDVWRYLLTMNVPYCHLYDEGYTSIGGRSNTSKNTTLKLDQKLYLPAYMLTDDDKERFGRH